MSHWTENLRTVWAELPGDPEERRKLLLLYVSDGWLTEQQADKHMDPAITCVEWPFVHRTPGYRGKVTF